MLNHLYNQTLAVESVTYDSYNKPTFKVGETIRAFVEYSVKKIKNSRGMDVISVSVIHTDSLVLISDIIYINNEHKEVLQVNTFRNLDGEVDHYEVYV